MKQKIEEKLSKNIFPITIEDSLEDNESVQEEFDEISGMWKKNSYTNTDDKITKLEDLHPEVRQKYAGLYTKRAKIKDVFQASQESIMKQEKADQRSQEKAFASLPAKTRRLAASNYPTV